MYMYMYIYNSQNVSHLLGDGRGHSVGVGFYLGVQFEEVLDIHGFLAHKRHRGQRLILIGDGRHRAERGSLADTAA